jgi:hypothetical protein
MDTRRERIKAEAAAVCWKLSSLWTSVDVIEFQAETYSKLALIRVKLLSRVSVYCDHQLMGSGSDESNYWIFTSRNYNFYTFKVTVTIPHKILHISTTDLP